MFFLYRFAAGRSASLDHLLHFLTSNLYSQPKIEKLKAQQLLFLIVESNSFDSSALIALRAAKTLADNGVEVFVFKVGGKQVINIDLSKVASEPLDTHVFQVNDFKDLLKASKAFNGKGKYVLAKNVRIFEFIISGTMSADITPILFRLQEMT